MPGRYSLGSKKQARRKEGSSGEVCANQFYCVGLNGPFCRSFGGGGKKERLNRNTTEKENLICIARRTCWKQYARAPESESWQSVTYIEAPYNRTRYIKVRLPNCVKRKF